MEARAPYQFLGVHRPAFGTGEPFLIFTDLHEALKDMLAGSAFKFIDRHNANSQ
jgi:SpoU rRNA methylase family enzyme